MPLREGNFQTVNREIREATMLQGVYTELQKSFPKAQLSIVINRRRPKVGGQPKEETLMFGRFTRRHNELPIYAASTMKFVHVAAASEYATRNNIASDSEEWTVAGSDTLITEYYEDLHGKPQYVESEPSMKRIEGIMEPLVSDEFIAFQKRLHDEEFKTGNIISEFDVLLEGIPSKEERILAQGLMYEHLSRSNKDLFSQYEKNYSDLKDEINTGKYVLGKTSLGTLIEAALGPSSNVAVMAISRTLGERDGSLTGPNVIQNFVHRMLGDNVLLTMNNSKKEQKNGYWNVAKQSELLKLYGMIMDGSEKLGISEEYIHLMREALEKHSADPAIEMTSRIKKKIPHVRVFEKSGYFNLDIPSGLLNSMPRFMKANGWNPELPFAKVATIGNVLRIEYQNGQVVDVAVSVAFPHEDLGLEHDQAQKVLASYMITDKVIELLTG